MPKVYIAARPNLIITGLLDYRQDEVHITMLYLGEVEDVDTVRAALNDSAYRRWPTEPVLCQIHGTGQWLTVEGGCVQVALVQPVLPRIQNHDIYDERRNMERALNGVGIKVDDTYPFVPHITLGYSSEPEAHVRAVRAPVMFAITGYHLSYQDSEGTWINEALIGADRKF